MLRWNWCCSRRGRWGRLGRRRGHTQWLPTGTRVAAPRPPAPLVPMIADALNLYGRTKMASKNTICLWYDGTAVDAARFYAETFPDSVVGAVMRAPGDYPAG